MLKRYLRTQIEADLEEKMVFLGGPRQSGKTTLARTFASSSAYLNWDHPDDRARILKLNLPATDTWIFDEIHKYKNWRNYIKGLYDKRGERKILVTGSARLDLLRRGGDSLQGRYHFLRLYPLSFDEVGPGDAKLLKRLFDLSGFPEPFLSGSQAKAKRWSSEYRQRVLQEDISSVEVIEDLGKAEHLLLNLPERVGSPLSVNSIREDLDVSHRSVSRWLDIFERFYAIFFLKPFDARGLRALKKERKHYHYDWTVIEDEGARFENLVAFHILKRIHFLNDSSGRSLELRYFRDTAQREVDFVVTEGKKVLMFVEGKLGDASINPHLKYLKRKFPGVAAYQVHLKGKNEFVDAAEGIEVLSAVRFLGALLPGAFGG